MLEGRSSMSKQDSAYYKRHRRVYKERGKARDYACAWDCGAQAREWAQIHGTDGESSDHYQPMCNKCHAKYDDKWNKAQRAKVSESTKRVWANSPERKQAMSVNPHRSRGASRLAQGGEA